MDEFKTKKTSEIQEVRTILKKISLLNEEEIPQKTPINEKKGEWPFIAWIISLFNDLFPKSSMQVSLKKLNKDLLDFKDCLILLTEVDLSQNATFLKRLSQTWKDFIQNFEPVALKKHPLILHVKKLFDELHTYPSKESFSLGYYLSLYAGEDWIPFPYMEILKNLYLEYQNDPEKSSLNKWIQHIQEITKFP